MAGLSLTGNHSPCCGSIFNWHNRRGKPTGCIPAALIEANSFHLPLPFCPSLPAEPSTLGMVLQWSRNPQVRAFHPLFCQCAYMPANLHGNSPHGSDNKECEEGQLWSTGNRQVSRKETFSRVHSAHKADLSATSWHTLGWNRCMRTCNSHNCTLYDQQICSRVLGWGWMQCDDMQITHES